MVKKGKITIGILAHVDAGKTTLSEGILFESGVIRQAGRVDNGDAFLDTDEQERNRGITIFSKEARFSLPSFDVTLLDTPGHVDFSAEMERTLQVLDYAVLVINGREGVQGHVLTLWKLLDRYNIPAFVFVNKMDLWERDGDDAARKAEEDILAELRDRLAGEFVDFRHPDPEEIAMCSEAAMEEYLEAGTISDAAIAKAIAGRCLTPCYFGSALKMRGIEELLSGLDRYCIDQYEGGASEDFRARVFKITRDRQGERLTHIKITSGRLRPRMSVDTGLDQDEKINQIRAYSGDKYTSCDEAEAGMVCTVTGLKGSYAGQTLPDDGSSRGGELEAAMSYGVRLPEGADPHKALSMLQELQEEDPQLRVEWNEKTQEIQMRLMGQVQLEVLSKIIETRFGMNVTFGEGRIAYKETIAEPVLCAGHFEPLRHYAEVHLLLEPLPRGSGIVIGSDCPEDELDRNWQRLITTHLSEKEHAGTLTGSPVTDIKITIIAGRAHLKHTEGGDFRQATYRALRQGFRKSLAAGQMVLLEPWYEFTLQIPPDQAGRAMSDVQRMGGVLYESAGGILTGRAPVSEMRDYASAVASYTKGFGHLTCGFCGYDECHDADRVIGEMGYDPDRDVDDPADSVFCSHGAGHNVPWDEADDMMHVKPQLKTGQTEGNEARVFSGGSMGPGGGADDAELERIFEMTYGRLKKESKKKPAIEARTLAPEKRKTKPAEKLPEYLLVDGYNIIFAWEELRELSRVNIDSAREALIEILSNYQGYNGCNLILVFDAYKVRGGERHIEKNDNITIVYTKEAETADTYIERTTYELAGKKYSVRVATSDRLEQMIIMGNNARKVSADDFKTEVQAVNDAISMWIQRNNWYNKIDHPNKIQIEPDRENDKEER
ncbi:MAG: TetM/TetW/TetO/TetS family tetracycline resistance ribosomal protection protein [Bacillota bacterium]|nr:TetM/TetW/TetO/TetS family tetracycline resistance ribosomal protection protein [Bacillota bacterium]